MFAPAPRPVARSPWRLARRVGLALLLALASSACGPEPADVCSDAYAHLLELGRRTHDSELRSRFVKACVEAWDAKKVACIRAATTADEALACEWFKKRPG